MGKTKELVKQSLENAKTLKKKAINRVYKYRTLRWIFPRAYKKYAKLPVDENKIVFIEVRLPELTNSFKLLYDELVGKYDFTVHTHFLRNKFVQNDEYILRCVDMMEDIATAKYVFVNEASNVVSCVKIRPETIVTQTWHGCGAFKKFGFSTAELIFGETRKEMLKFPYYKNYTYVTLSSAEVAWAYEEAMNLSQHKEVLKPVGTSRTDIFYDKDFIQAAYDKLHIFMPSSIGKKVILYAPTFRGRVANGQTPDMLDVGMFSEQLGGEYVLLFKHHPLVLKPPVIAKEYREFAVDLTDAMSIEELLCVSDICISDYSSLVFEYSLFERPMIFFAYDLSEYFDWRGFYYDYYELAPGPVFTTNRAMIDYILHIKERFNKQRVQDFRKKFMEACDGHATERILRMVFADNLAAHKKPQPLPDDYHRCPDAKQLFRVERKHLEALRTLKEQAPPLYAQSARQPVDGHKVVFLESSRPAEALKRVKAQLKKKPGVSIVTLKYEKEELQKTIGEMAAAAYLVISGKTDLINVLEIRPETKVVQIWDKAFVFGRFGYSTKAAKGGLLKEELTIASLHRNYGIVPVSSPKTRDVLMDGFQIREEQVYREIGSCATDFLFDGAYREKAVGKLNGIFPETKGKKIIFYLPTPRMALTRQEGRCFVDYRMMNEYLGEEYCVAYYDEEENAEELHKMDKLFGYFTQFIRNMAGRMTVTELMAAADLMIGDYREETFSYAACGRPIFLYAPDYRTYFFRADAYFDYEEVAPGPICTETKQIVEGILHLDQYDDSRLQRFRQDYLRLCDGQASKRVADIMYPDEPGRIS